MWRTVSLVWGCELKEVNGKERRMWRTGSASYEAVNWKNPTTKAFTAAEGQPRMRLWIERYIFWNLSSPIWVSLVWGCELKVSSRQSLRESARVSLVWGCELKGSLYSLLLILYYRSASYEAVNWKVRWCNERACDGGQPRMRLWIERHLPETWNRILIPVSLVWGCELKDSWI